MADQYNILAEMEKLTVVTKYDIQPRDDTGAQSEKALEDRLLAMLQHQGYEYAHITTEPQLIDNLRKQLEHLNDYTFTDNEWKQFFDKELANETLTLEDKTNIIQRIRMFELHRDNGDIKNIRLLDTTNVFRNQLQVIHQYTPTGGTHKTRYDVTILVNGLPMVHIELKRRGVNIREAFNQIHRYERTSFDADHRLFEFVQIYVISNGTQTKYYSNSTRYAQEKAAAKQKTKTKIQSTSFEFTSYWADAKNQILADLEDFTKTFLSKQTLLNILLKYCVFTVDKELMVMRPYQIAATERILLRIRQALYNKWSGTIKSGGYIWHTTGSGKTLTSFKTAQLASKMDDIQKVLFVVDRKDLDYQTMREYNNFEPECANSNTNINVLEKQLNNPNCTIIITTIQKLSTLLKKRKESVLCLKENVVFIFDECHRSQFGDMHALITRSFKKYFLFGFTGTPIFAVNAGKSTGLTTTAQAFGGELDENNQPTRALHTYTIINAINDKNVLKFKVDYIRTMGMKNDIKDKEVWGIETAEALADPRRIEGNVRYILQHFGQKTKQGQYYAMSHTTNIEALAKKQGKVSEEKMKMQHNGFNSIFAVDSVSSAIAYYDEFARQQKGIPEPQRLKVGTIFTFAANEEENDLGILEEENPESTQQLDASSRDALERAIGDYNKMFGTSYSTDGDSFQNYYKDMSLRMKNKELDVLIVVGMFLTGFDSKTVNTLWVDKNLKYHGLLQAFSRTNRILNSVKDCGNIVCFRNLEEATNKAIALFGDEDASGLVLMRPFNDYYDGYWEQDEKGKDTYHMGYKEVVEALLSQYPSHLLYAQYFSEESKRLFVRLFGQFLKLRNILSSFDEFESQKIIGDGVIDDYKSWYIDLREELTKPADKKDKENINDDLVFEMELMAQITYGIDYILRLVAEYHEGNCKNKEIVVKIQKVINGNPEMRDKRDLITRFVEQMTPEKTDVYDSWDEYVSEERDKELESIIAEENLNAEATHKFIEQSWQQGYVTETGLGITKLLPPMPVFGAKNKRAEKKQTVTDRLKAFFTRYFGIADYTAAEQPATITLLPEASATMEMAAEEEE